MFPSSLKRLQRGQDPRHGTFVQFKLHPSRHLFRFLFHLIFHVRFMVVPLPLTLIQHLQHKAPDFFIIERQPYRASLPRIFPVLPCQHRIDDTLVCVARNSNVFDWHGSAWVGENIPGARTVFFEDSGHMLFWEEPEKFNRTVTEFIKGL